MSLIRQIYKGELFSMLSTGQVTKHAFYICYFYDIGPPAGIEPASAVRCHVHHHPLSCTHGSCHDCLSRMLLKFSPKLIIIRNQVNVLKYNANMTHDDTFELRTADFRAFYSRSSIDHSKKDGDMSILP